MPRTPNHVFYASQCVAIRAMPKILEKSSIYKKNTLSLICLISKLTPNFPKDIDATVLVYNYAYLFNTCISSVIMYGSEVCVTTCMVVRGV